MVFLKNCEVRQKFSRERVNGNQDIHFVLFAVTSTVESRDVICIVCAKRYWLLVNCMIRSISN